MTNTYLETAWLTAVIYEAPSIPWELALREDTLPVLTMGHSPDLYRLKE